MTITARISSKGICQPRREACRLNRWAAWDVGPTVHCIKRLAWSADTKVVHIRGAGGNEWGSGSDITQDVSSQAFVFPKLHLYRARLRNKAKTSC